MLLSERKCDDSRNIASIFTPREKRKKGNIQNLRTAIRIVSFIHWYF